MPNDYVWVKYYSNNDLSIGFNLEQAESVIKNIDSEKEYKNVNEVIELFNIQQLMESGVLLKKWDEQTIYRLKNTCKSFNAKIGKYFATIDTANFVEVFQNVDTAYIEDFWLLFSKYKAFSRVEGNALIEILTKGIAALWPILEHKDIVCYYDTELAVFMRTSDQSAEILLDQNYAVTKRKYFFPKSLLTTEYETIIDTYIDSQDPNVNYLKLLTDAQSLEECPLSPKLRQKAKHRYEKEIAAKSEKGIGFQYGVNIGFDAIDSYISKDYSNTLIPQIVYSTKWIEENLDYPTLLNNFRYVFEQVDFCWRSNLVALESDMGILERSFGLKGKKEYRTGIQFHVVDMKTLGQIHGYRNILSRNGIDLENVFKWFFETYLEEEFHVNGFLFHASSCGTSIVERIKNLASEMDGSLKQFRAYVNDGFIDRELLEMTSEQMKFSQLRSLFLDKYAYSNSPDIKRELFLLFSDQSSLTYTEKTEAKYEAFDDLINTEQMLLSDFAEYQIGAIKWLISRGVILEDKKGILHLNTDRHVILKDLYTHEVICPFYYKSVSKTLDSLLVSGDLRYESTLFSKPEQDYLNYMLNKAEFSNGHDLRNKYLHGSYSQNEKEQECDYDHMLVIMALVIMKINQELCMKFPIKH